VYYATAAATAMCESITFKTVCKDCRRPLDVRTERHECEKYQRLGVCGNMGYTKQETREVPKGWAESCDCS